MPSSVVVLCIPSHSLVVLLILNWLRYLFRSFLHLPSFSLANWVVYCLFISQNNMIFKYGEVSLTCHDCAKTLKNKLCWGLGV